jgi:hypothetical protein
LAHLSIHKQRITEKENQDATKNEHQSRRTFLPVPFVAVVRTTVTGTEYRLAVLNKLSRKQAIQAANTQSFSGRANITPS